MRIVSDCPGENAMNVKDVITAGNHDAILVEVDLNFSITIFCELFYLIFKVKSHFINF